MKYNTLDSFNVAGKKILLRIDLNSEISSTKVTLSERFIAHAKTIKELQQKQAQIVVIAHQGRKGEKDCISLRQHAQLLAHYARITFVTDIIGKKALAAIASLKNGDAILLENLRFLDDEMHAGDAGNALIATLSPLFDYYVADALSILHREQASVVDFPKHIPSCIGRVLEEELAHISKITLKSCLFILGGAKPEDSLLLMQQKQEILACGIFGHLCLIAKGHNLGAQNTFLAKDMKFIPDLKKYVSAVATPHDLAVNASGKRKELRIEEFPSTYEVFDIGALTIADYVERINTAETIFMRGTAGFCEEEQFRNGTKALFTAIAKSSAFSVLSGGHTITALRTLKISRSKFDYISLSGGALVRYIAGKKLPGLEALQHA